MSGIIGGAGSKSGTIGETFGRGNVPAFAVRPNSDVSLGAPTAGGTFVFDATELDTHDQFDADNERFICSVPGLWLLCANMSYTRGTHSQLDYGNIYSHIELTPAASTYSDTSAYSVWYNASGGNLSDATHDLDGNVTHTLVKLHVGQVAKVKFYVVGGNSGIKYSSWSHFFGHLVG